MEDIYKMSYCDFVKSIVLNTLPNVDLKPVPRMIRSVGCAFGSPEEHLCSMYNNRHYLEYYSVMDCLKKFHIEKKTNFDRMIHNIDINRLETYIDELFICKIWVEMFKMFSTYTASEMLVPWMPSVVKTISPSIQETILISTIIAPHGITDLIHAYHTKKSSGLFTTYVSSLCVSYGLDYFHCTDVLVGILCIASFFHFRHDFRYIENDFVTNICSLATLYSMIQYPSTFFYAYMSCWHVPQHYFMALPYIKPYFSQTLFSISSIALATFFLLHISSISTKPVLFVSGIGIILGHILYEELIIHKQLSTPVQTIK